MISSSVIALLLVSVALGLLFAVVCIYLLASKKINGGPFWLGVAGYSAGTLATAIITAIYTAVYITSNANADPIKLTKDPAYLRFVTICTVITLCLSMLLFVSIKRKKISFKRAISTGLGFAVSNAVSNALTCYTNYSQCRKINAGTFEKQYRGLVESNLYSDDMVNSLKQAYFDITVSTTVNILISILAYALITIGICVAIGYGFSKKKGFVSFLACLVVYTITALIQSFIDQQSLLIIISTVVLAALAGYIIYVVKNKFVSVEAATAPAIEDSFIDTVNNSKNDASDDNEVVNTNTNNN